MEELCERQFCTSVLSALHMPCKLRFPVKTFHTSACEAHLKPSYCSSSPIFGENKREIVEGEEGCLLSEACVENATSCVAPNNGSLVGTLSMDNGSHKQALLQKRSSKIQLTNRRKGKKCTIFRKWPFMRFFWHVNLSFCNLVGIVIYVSNLYQFISQRRLGDDS